LQVNFYIITTAIKGLLDESFAKGGIDPDNDNNNEDTNNDPTENTMMLTMVTIYAKTCETFGGGCAQKLFYRTPSQRSHTRAGQLTPKVTKVDHTTPTTSLSPPTQTLTG